MPPSRTRWAAHVAAVIGMCCIFSVSLCIPSFIFAFLCCCSQLLSNLLCCRSQHRSGASSGLHLALWPQPSDHSPSEGPALLVANQHCCLCYSCTPTYIRPFPSDIATLSTTPLLCCGCSCITPRRQWLAAPWMATLQPRGGCSAATPRNHLELPHPPSFCPPRVSALLQTFWYPFRCSVYARACLCLPLFSTYIAPLFYPLPASLLSSGCTAPLPSSARPRSATPMACPPVPHILAASSKHCSCSGSRARRGSQPMLCGCCMP